MKFFVPYRLAGKSTYPAAARPLAEPFGRAHETRSGLPEPRKAATLWATAPRLSPALINTEIGAVA